MFCLFLFKCRFNTFCFCCSLRAGIIIIGLLQLILIAPPALILNYFGWFEENYINDGNNWLFFKFFFSCQIIFHVINAFAAILGASSRSKTGAGTFVIFKLTSSLMDHVFLINIICGFIYKFDDVSEITAVDWFILITCGVFCIVSFLSWNVANSYYGQLELEINQSRNQDDSLNQPPVPASEPVWISQTFVNETELNVSSANGRPSTYNQGRNI